MLYSDLAPATLNTAPRRKFVGSGFDNFLLGLSGTDAYGNANQWGKVKGTVLPAVYGTLGAIGTTVAGLGPGVGAKFGSQLGSGINSITGSFGSSLLKGTDGADDYAQQQTKSATQSQTVASVIGQVGGLLGGGSLPTGATAATSKLGAVAPYVSQVLSGGGSGSGFMDLNNSFDPLEEEKKRMDAQNYGQIMFKGGGEVPLWVKTLKSLGQTGTTGYQGKIYNLDNLPTDMPASSTSVERPQMVGSSVLDRLAAAEGSRYDQKNSVGPGHFGKYQFEPMLIQKYAGVSPDEFLRNPQLQELAMRRRLGDLRTEATTAIKRSGSDMNLDDAMLLVHFKGMGRATEEMKNPALMNQRSRFNPSSNMYINYRSIGKNSVAGKLGQSFQSMFKDGGQVKIYGKNDDTEDYFMVDKSVAKRTGMYDTINKISFGQARYGERIFDQESNLTMKKIVGSTLPETQKAALLGKHVLGELKTHDDIIVGQQMFQKGGQVKKPKNYTVNGKVYDLSPDPNYPNRYINVGDSQGYYQFNASTGKMERVNGKTYSAPSEPTVTVNKGTPKRKPLLEELTYPLRQLGLMGSTTAPAVGKATMNPTPSRPVAAATTPMGNVRPMPMNTGGAGGVGTTPSPTTPNPTATGASAFTFDPTATEQVINAQRRINQLGSTLLPGFKPLAQDGKWGQATEIADRQLKARLGNAYNITTTRAAIPTQYGAKVMITSASTNDPKALTPKLGYAPMGLSGQVGTFTPQQLADKAKLGMKASIAQTGILKPTVSTTQSADALNKVGEIASYLPDVGRLIAGATIANANRPKPFSLGQDYFRMKSELENRRNTGLLPEQRALYINNLTNGYLTGVEALRSATAGGAGVGAMVAGLGRLGQSYNQGVVGLANLDNAQRQQNQAAYQGSVMQDLNLRQGLFNREEAIRGANRQGAGMLMGAAVDNIQNRMDFNRQYGPGSQYDQMQTYMTDLYKQTTEAQKAQTQAFLNSLKK